MNDTTSLSLFLVHQSSLPIRRQYNIHTSHITALLGIYFYCKYINDTFTIHAIIPIIRSFSHKRMVKYIDTLVNCKLIEKVSNIPYNKYTITQAGEEAINNIVNEHNRLIFEFCNTHNIVL